METGITCAYLVGGAALDANFQGHVLAGSRHAVPGVAAVWGPAHKQVVAVGPEQQVLALRLLQALQQTLAASDSEAKQRCVRLGTTEDLVVAVGPEQRVGVMCVLETVQPSLPIRHFSMYI